MFKAVFFIGILALIGMVRGNRTKRSDFKTALLNEKRAPLMAVLDMTDVNENIHSYVDQAIESGLSDQIEQKTKEAVATEIDSVIKNCSENGNLFEPSSTEIDEARDEIEVLLNQIHRLQSKLNVLEGRTKAGISMRVAFTAVLSKSISLGDKQIIRYDKVKTNVGNAYDPATGIFTSPSKGVYSLSVSMMGDPNNGIHLQLVKNGNELVRLWTGGGGSYELASQTINVELAYNDKVWVQRRASTGAKIYGGEQYNVFSAVLVFE